jgi:glucose-1-phosphate thymidylyltransferase
MIEGLKPGAKNEYQITDAIQRLIEAGGVVTAETVEGWWKDTGKPEDILDANRLVLMGLKREIGGKLEASELVGEVVVGAGSIVRNSTVFGPVLIGQNAVIEDAFIGPYTTIGDGVKIKNAELEYAVVGANTTITAVKTRVQASLIGENVQLAGQRGRPNTHKLVIGDMSQVVLQESW